MSSGMKATLVFGGMAIVILAVAIISPKGSPQYGSVNENSKVSYKIGEKVKAQPFNGNTWYDGKVSAITSEDQYVVTYCGNIGWFHKWECTTEELRRSQMAKVENP